MYSCQLDAVVGDVREATRRRARGVEGEEGQGGGGGEATQDLHLRSSGHWREHGLTHQHAGPSSYQKPAEISQRGIDWISVKENNAHSSGQLIFHLKQEEPAIGWPGPNR